MRVIILSLFLGFSLYANDRKFSHTAFPRHVEMVQNYQKKKPNWEYLTGNWGSGRKWLADHGVTFTSSYTADPLGNPVGGRHRSFSYTGSFGLDMTLSFEKIAGWEGWYFYSAFVWRLGTNLSAKKIDNQFNVAQVYGGQTYKLNNMYIRKESPKRNFILLFGRLDAGDDFLHSTLYHYYVNNGFCGNPVAIFLNTPFTTYPNSNWGANVQLTLETPENQSGCL